MQSQVDRESFLLIDEADFILTDGLQQVENPKCVGLTATAFGEQYAVEREHLERQGFHLLDSKMGGFIHPDIATTKATLAQFFAESEGYAKLVFATPGVALTTFEKTQQPSERDCEDLARLKCLAAQDVLLVTKPELMRGVDYRVEAGTQGISLLIMSKFSNTRAYVQALGRVGRFTEKARRFVWDGVVGTPVDEHAEVLLMAELR